MSSEEGSALVAVLIMVLLLTLLMGVLLSIQWMNHKLSHIEMQKIQVRYSAESALYRSLSTFELEHFAQNGFQTIHYDTIAGFQCQTDVSEFGGFLQVNSTARNNNLGLHISALVGKTPDTTFNYAIILGDQKTELSITGSTEIHGNILTGPNGTEITEFRGESFSGIIDGEYHTRQTYTLPDVHIDYYDRLFKSYINTIKTAGLKNKKIKGEPISTLRSFIKDSVNQIHIKSDNLHLIADSTLTIPSKTTIIVDGNIEIGEGIEIKPLVRIYVSGTMKVNKGAKINQSLLFTKDSLILDGGAMSGQFLSTGPIRVNNGVKLKYPSFVMSSYGKVAQELQNIHIQKGAQVEGTVLFWLNNGNNYESKVVVDSGSLVRGAVISNMYVELAGSVEGSVITRQFHFYDSPTDYVNWIKEGQVNVNKRPADYTVPLALGVGTNFQLTYRNDSKTN